MSNAKGQEARDKGQGARACFVAGEYTFDLLDCEVEQWMVSKGDVVLTIVDDRPDPLSTEAHALFRLLSAVRRQSMEARA
ncbi:MAG: hypothetical protein KC492_16160 [Myxococcales bacterium]|nr:hypothetical protein [Myxococcales bacterium]